MQPLNIALPDSLTAFALRTAVIVVVSMILLWLTARVSSRLDGWARQQGNLAPTEGEKRLRTASNIVRYAVSLLVVGVAVGMILREIGIDVVPLLAGASFLGLLLGFGAQNLVKDYIGGFFLLVENQYSVGDIVELNGVSGRVDRITLRVTQLRDVAGKVHFIPNGDVRLVSNLTKEWSRAVLDVSVAYREDVDRVITVLEDLGAEMAGDEDWGSRLTEAMRVMGVQDLADSGVIIRVAFTTVPETQWDVAREFRKRVKRRFDAEGIEIPFPHRTIYLRDTERAATRAGDGEPVAPDPGNDDRS